MKVFINNRNYVTWPQRMAVRLVQQGHKVVLVDNDSTYPPLLKAYEEMESAGIRVVRLGENVGPYAVWNRLANELTEPYVVTDPDLDISTVPADWPDALMKGIEMSGYPKCGLSLDERYVPRSNPAWQADEFWRYPNNDHPTRWGRFMDHEGRRYYAYPTDTTFALYLPGHAFSIGGTRVGPPYMAKHLPWHLVQKPDASDVLAMQIPMDDEIRYYFAHANKHFSYTKARFDEEQELDEAVGD